MWKMLERISGSRILRSQLRTELGEKKKKQYRLYRVHNGAVIDH
jgi:hypothetical protein